MNNPKEGKTTESVPPQLIPITIYGIKDRASALCMTGRPVLDPHDIPYDESLSKNENLKRVWYRDFDKTTRVAPDGKQYDVYTMTSEMNGFKLAYQEIVDPDCDVSPYIPRRVSAVYGKGKDGKPIEVRYERYLRTSQNPVTGEQINPTEVIFMDIGGSSASFIVGIQKNPYTLEAQKELADILEIKPEESHW